MTAIQQGTAEDLTGHLQRLAASLEGMGLVTRAVPGRRHPCLKVTNPRIGRLSEDIYAACSRDGAACFWWSWGERIDTVANELAVATRIVIVLS